MRNRLDNTSYVTNNSVGFIIILVLIHQEQWIVHVSVHIWVWTNAYVLRLGQDNYSCHPQAASGVHNKVVRWVPLGILLF